GAPASLRVISSTGEASNAEDYRWLMESTGVPVIEYCGGTEIGGGYVTATVVEPAVPARFTTPTLGLDFVLLDEDGMSGDTGEVFLVPPSIGLSTELLNRDHHRIYYDGVPAWSRQLRRHGDQMRRDGSGRYQALGRVDDTMNLGGIKVSSADLESALSVVDGIGEVAAIGSPPPGGGPERLVLFVVPDPAVEVTTEEVLTKAQSAIRVRLNPLFKVHDVVFVGSLPRTASQKVMRRTLRAEYDR
ncbi:MAG: AMP-dependent synthetase, partial [Acidimicrobiia bacterium]|nr:AMP-dependent synthetase [Acidimicrobiia bacterium]